MRIKYSTLVIVSILVALFINEVCINNSINDVEQKVEMIKSINAYTDVHHDMRDYQLEIIEDTIEVFDGNRLVGKMFYEEDSELGKLIDGDNQ